MDQQRCKHWSGCQRYNTEIPVFTATKRGYITSVTATITVTPHFENGAITCDGPVKTFTITVNPTAQVNDPANQETCNNSPVAAVNFTSSNTGGTTTYTWINDDASIGLAANGTGNISAFTAINTGTEPVIATIEVTPHFANGGVTCDGPAQTFTLTVNPTPDVSTTSLTTFCSGTSTNIELTSNVGGATFSWTIGGVTGGITGASASSGSTIAQILVNPGTAQGTVTYVVTPTANSCSGTPVSIVVTVNPTPNVTTVGPTTICSATTTNITLNSNVIGATFSWTIGGTTGGITGASASAGLAISQTLTNPGTAAGTVTYIVTPTANSCPGTSTNVVVTVNPTPDVTTTSPTTICSSTTTNIELTGNVSGTTFSWTIGAITGGISGATASNGSTIAQTLYNPGLASGSVTYIITPTANSCSGNTTSLVITVNPSTGATEFTAGATEVCQDAPDETYTATASNITSIVYSVSPAAAGVIDASTGLMNWDASFSGTATITATSTGLCGTTTETRSVRVKALPAITIQPESKAACEFGIVTFSVTATGSDLTYKWYVDQNTGTFIPVTAGGVYSGETSASLQIWSTVRTMDNYKYHVVVSGCLPDVTSSDATLTVNQAPEISSHPSDLPLCLGADGTMSADGTGTSVTWQWEVNRNDGNGFVTLSEDANFSGVTGKTLSITDAQSSFTNWGFRAKATGTCGAPAYTNFGRLTVTNPPTVVTQPAAKEICENGTTSFLAIGSGYSGLQWQVSTDNGSSWSDIGLLDTQYLGAGSNQLTVLNAPVSLNNNQYRLGLIGSCTTIPTNGVVLKVNPNPIVDFSAADTLNACGGVPLVINGNPTGGTAPYAQHRLDRRCWTD